jgi:hypothetical protein
MGRRVGLRGRSDLGIQWFGLDGGENERSSKVLFSKEEVGQEARSCRGLRGGVS